MHAVMHNRQENSYKQVLDHIKAVIGNRGHTLILLDLIVAVEN